MMLLQKYYKLQKVGVRLQSAATIKWRRAYLRKSGRAMCLRATEKTVATHSLLIRQIMKNRNFDENDFMDHTKVNIQK